MSFGTGVVVTAAPTFALYEVMEAKGLPDVAEWWLIMQARLSCDGAGSVRDGRALADWLRRVDELRGSVKLVGAQVQPGRMGGISDVVGIALGSGGAVTVLIRSVFVWLGQRAQGTRVLLDIEKGDGRRLHLELTGADDSGAVIDRVVAALGDDSAVEGAVSRAPRVDEVG